MSESNSALLNALSHLSNLSASSIAGLSLFSLVLGALSTLIAPTRRVSISSARPFNEKGTAESESHGNKNLEPLVNEGDALEDDEDDLTDKKQRRDSANSFDSFSRSDSEYSSNSDSDSASDSDEEFKLVLVLRTDLPTLTKAKAASHCAQATLANYKACLGSSSPSLKESLRTWQADGQPKITLKCRDEDELVRLQGKAWEVGMVARCVVDTTIEKGKGKEGEGRGVRTVLAIGPGMSQREQ